jgi:hypothetical protein
VCARSEWGRGEAAWLHSQCPPAAASDGGALISTDPEPAALVPDPSDALAWLRYKLGVYRGCANRLARAFEQVSFGFADPALFDVATSSLATPRHPSPPLF